MPLLARLLVPLVVAALVVAALVAFVFDGGRQKTLTAEFPRTVSLYVGSDVRVLGVPVGKVDSVTPSGTQVRPSSGIRDTPWPAATSASTVPKSSA